MSTPSDSRAASVERADAPPPFESESVSKLRRLAALRVKYTSDPTDPWPALVIEMCDAYDGLRSALAEREAECERLRADAERYRAIREMGWSVEFNGLWTGAAAWRVHDDELRYHHAPSLDDAVDKARAASAAGVAPAARETQETNDNA